MGWYWQEVCDWLGYHPWPGNGNGVQPDREVACCVQSLLLLIPAWYARSRSILPRPADWTIVWWWYTHYYVDTAVHSVGVGLSGVRLQAHILILSWSKRTSWLCTRVACIQVACAWVAHSTGVHGKAPTRKAGYYDTGTVHREGGLITRADVAWFNSYATQSNTTQHTSKTGRLTRSTQLTCTAEELIRCWPIQLFTLVSNYLPHSFKMFIITKEE